MIAILKALDVIKHDDLNGFFDKLASENKYKILFKSKKDWNYVNNQASDQEKSLLKSDFNNVKNIPEFISIITSKGNIKIKLLPEVAPITVKSFLSLAKTGYFNGLSFHRVVPGFVIQGGDPRGDGWGGPGYSLPCEYSMLEYETGMVGMAHAGMDTGGSQFFITQMPQPHLNGRYTIWGKVIGGMSVVNEILPYDKIIKIEMN
ncbi:MAG: peptidylprolyl isomerase [Calditrichia bacterium]|nr:peptidylprolyl isomerase [Calditrichia bacterium]